MTRPELRVLPDAAAASGAVARLLVEAVEAGGSIALSGGSTPRDAYERAAALETDWGGATVWLADERCVPRDHADSNERLIRDHLLRLTVIWISHCERIIALSRPQRSRLVLGRRMLLKKGRHCSANWILLTKELEPQGIAKFLWLTFDPLQGTRAIFTAPPPGHGFQTGLFVTIALHEVS